MVTSADFDACFRLLNAGRSPYPWQCRLVEQLVEGCWPGAISLPTGSGKTAIIDIVVFALACQATRPPQARTVPLRLFFCVNRRIIVDEAHARARRLARALIVAEAAGVGVLADMAAALRTLTGDARRANAPPLDVLELRGGIYRDNRWARSATQPTVVCTTVDQLGSRLLFRGYGVSANAAPIHAALIAHDSVVVLDEAHISEPFRQTLEAVRARLVTGAERSRYELPLPLIHLPMTATPTQTMREQGVVALDEADRCRPELAARLAAPKPARLRVVKSVTKDALTGVLKALAAHAPSAVGVIVNRVATAREIHQQLLECRAAGGKRAGALTPDTPIELVIGSMRPLDRDRQAIRLAPLIGADRPMPVSERSSVVVATQCLEVGADYDFDHLITECASLDALQQRFGRLNRGGRRIADGSFVPATGLILITQRDVNRLTVERSSGKAGKSATAKPKHGDPIYGLALGATWAWLCAQGDALDFGIDAFARLLEQTAVDGGIPPALLAPGAGESAPVLLPAHLDLLCQTGPRPAAEPDIALFLHGSRPTDTDVQVCWRADLVMTDHANGAAGERNDSGTAHWVDIVALLPPTAAECMRVPISRVRRWLDGPERSHDESADLPGLVSVPESARASQAGGRALRPRGVIWRGIRDSVLLERASRLRPGDTLVLPAHCPGASDLGYLPELDTLSARAGAAASDARKDGGSRSEDTLPPDVTDLAEEASLAARDRAALRLRMEAQPQFAEELQEFKEVIDAVNDMHDRPMSTRDVQALLRRCMGELSSGHPLSAQLGPLTVGRLKLTTYPDGRGAVVQTAERLGRDCDWFPAFADEGNDEASAGLPGRRVTLAMHAADVVRASRDMLSGLAIAPDLGNAIAQAADLHDDGKADERFQAFLRRGVRTEAWLSEGRAIEPLAKSGGLPLTIGEGRTAATRAELPRGFRHEMLSLQLAAHTAKLPDDPQLRALVLHLIAAHHGHARPFAPVVMDAAPPTVVTRGRRLDASERAAWIPAHRLDSGIAERFWQLNRDFGWWGLAYLESILRLADWQASADEVSFVGEQATSAARAEGAGP